MPQSQPQQFRQPGKQNIIKRGTVRGKIPHLPNRAVGEDRDVGDIEDLPADGESSRSSSPSAHPAASGGMRWKRSAGVDLPAPLVPTTPSIDPPAVSP